MPAEDFGWLLAAAVALTLAARADYWSGWGWVLAGIVFRICGLFGLGVWIALTVRYVLWS